MSEVSFAPQSATVIPPVTIRETLRPVDLPTGTLRIVAPLIPGPRPAAPKQKLTGRPLAHDGYGDLRQQPTPAADRIGRPSAWAAFNGELPGGAA